MKEKIIILAISDIHDRWEVFDQRVKELYKANHVDAIFIAGDLTNYGFDNPKEVNRMLDYLENWSGMAPVFLVLGNHDKRIRNDFFDGLNNPNLTSLVDRGLEFKGWKVFGISLSTAYSNPSLANVWDYMTVNPELERAVFENIPSDTDILLTHTPPLYLLDLIPQQALNVGSRVLTDRLRRKELSPSIILCGHIHEQGGFVTQYKDTLVYNVAGCVRLLELEPKT